MILDAGTGIRPLGMALGRRTIAKRIHHLHHAPAHLDHHRGPPLLRSDLGRVRRASTMWGPRVTGPLNLREPDHARVLRSALLPRSIFREHPRPTPTFRDLRRPAAWRIGSRRPLTARPRHASGADRRLSASRRPARRARLSPGSRAGARTGHRHGGGRSTGSQAGALAGGADGRCCTTRQYLAGGVRRARIGWGHSSVDRGRRRRSRAGPTPERLVLFHHDPLHSDEQLERILARANQLRPSGDADVELAREGMTFEL